MFERKREQGIEFENSVVKFPHLSVAMIREFKDNIVNASVASLRGCTSWPTRI